MSKFYKIECYIQEIRLTQQRCLKQAQKSSQTCFFIFPLKATVKLIPFLIFINMRTLQCISHPTHLTFLINSNHSACSKTCFSFKVLQFSFVRDSIFNITSIATVSASLFPIFYVEHDIPSSINTTMSGLALLKVKCIFILFRQLKPQEVSTSSKHYFVQYLAYMKKFPSQDYKVVSKILTSKT